MYWAYGRWASRFVCPECTHGDTTPRFLQKKYLVHYLLLVPWNVGRDISFERAARFLLLGPGATTRLPHRPKLSLQSSQSRSLNLKTNPCYLFEAPLKSLWDKVRNRSIEGIGTLRRIQIKDQCVRSEYALLDGYYHSVCFWGNSKRTKKLDRNY